MYGAICVLLTLQNSSYTLLRRYSSGVLQEQVRQEVQELAPSTPTYCSVAEDFEPKECGRLLGWDGLRSWIVKRAKKLCQGHILWAIAQHNT